VKLEAAFRTRTAARLSDLLLASPDRVYTQAMLVSRPGLGKRTVRDAVNRLATLGVPLKS